MGNPQVWRGKMSYFAEIDYSGDKGADVRGLESACIFLHFIMDRFSKQLRGVVQDEIEAKAETA